VKAISAGQNLEVADSTWLIFRQQGAIVKEADGGNRGTEGKFDENDVLAEKVALHLQDINIGGGMDVTNLEGHDEGERNSVGQRWIHIR
jgi:hypothetical protein